MLKHSIKKTRPGGNAIVLCLSLLLVFCGTPAIAQGKETQRHVIMISLDGFGWKMFLDNPKAKIPTIRKLLAEGAGGPMKVAFPSVTWVSHTSLATGAFPREHGVTGNSILNRKSGEIENLIGDSVFNKGDLVKVPTIYDLAKTQRNMKTAAISWPLTRGSNTLDYIVAEAYSQAVYVKTAKPDTFFDKLKSHDIPVERFGLWSELAVSQREDWLTTRVANYLIEKDTPDLMLVHFLVTDSYSHLYNAGSAESYWAAEYLDDRVREIIEKLKEKGIYERTNIFIVADHGFHNITKAIKPNVLLKLNGYLNVDNKGVINSQKAITVMNHGAAHVYVLDDENRAKILADIKPKLEKLEGIKAVYDQADFNKLGLPDPKDDHRMADLILEAMPGYYIINDFDGVSTLGPVAYAATHGHDPDHPDMMATFIASGPDIKKGVRLDDVTVMDVTPTIAKILNLKMPESWPGKSGRWRAGRVLSEALR